MNKTLFAAAGALALTGCLSASDPAPIQPFGSVTLASAATGEGATARPYARFFRARRDAVRTVNSRLVSNQCVVGPFTPGTLTSEQFGDLRAGSALGLTIGSVETTMPQRVAGSSYNYRTADAITFTPGDSAHISVPGEEGQFPAVELAIKTADAFTLAPVGVPELGENLDLSWTPGDTSSAMLISLRYASQGSPNLDQQIFCDVSDLGLLTLDSTILTGWVGADPGLRQVVATRVRTDQTGSEQGFLLHAFSSYDFVGTVATP